MATPNNQEGRPTLRTLLQICRSIVTRLRGGPSEPWRAGLSVAIGLFVGVQPLYGLHLPLCLIICLPLRLDALLAYAAANISNPLFLPLILLSEIQIGSLIIQGSWIPIQLSQIKGANFGHLVAELGVGSIVFGGLLSVLGGLFAAGIARISKKIRNRGSQSLGSQDHTAAIVRTCFRYRTARAADRHYVALKLRFDPVVRAICDTTAQLGDVVDVGCGRGQLGLLLCELGKIRSLTGFDWDERKIATARIAATDMARYSVGDAQTATLPEADTILIVDVLHYLPLAAQDDLLARAAGSLRKGGRIIVRDVDARHTLASSFTQYFERLGTRYDINRGGALAFRSRQRQCETLQRQGLTVIDTIGMPRLFLDNVLFVAIRPQDSTVP